ncbi:MAG: radical SAM protein, partial [Campylobacterales bacterium]|nr:radical SAM protein [Campylobacterales bacterium]
EQFDVIFLDPFVEHTNASLVSLEFIKLLKTHLKPTGVLVASTSFQAVHDALILAGFEVEMVHYVGSDMKGVIARVLEGSNSLHVSHPYRDPYLVWSDKKIERAHQTSYM